MIPPSSRSLTSLSRARLRFPPAIQQARTVSYDHTTTPVELQYDKVIPPDGNETGNPLVLLHGLFGTKRNFGSLSKAFAKDLGRPVYALDLRNHGNSPHAAPHTYEAMADDVLHFFSRHGLTNVSLLGHSMGGKVAMTIALRPDKPPDLISHLIVEDIAPSRGQLSASFKGYIHGMQKINDANVKTRQQADRILMSYEQDAMTRAFLLMNLESPTPRERKPLKFKIPLDLIDDSIYALGGFPYLPGRATWEGPTLMVKGLSSGYIHRRNLATTKMFFPNMALEVLKAGHWVHSERPEEFKHLVVDFILDRRKPSSEFDPSHWPETYSDLQEVR